MEIVPNVAAMAGHAANKLSNDMLTMIGSRHMTD